MIAERFDTFLLDLDGVVYVGDATLPGAVEALRRLRSQGKTLRFLTNDPRPTRESGVRRLAGMEIEAHPTEVITCGWATARYLTKSGLESAYVVGSDGLATEIKATGITLRAKGTPDAVVVGCSEDVGYPHIRRAARMIRAGARFIATNDDPTFPTPDGPAPATGAIVAAVRTASGEKPLILGKPNPEMFRAALAGVDGDAVMVGDSLRTDIAGAQELGIPTVWIADGPVGEALEAADDSTIEPDARIRTLSELFDPQVTIG